MGLTDIKNTPWGVSTCRDLCPDSIFRGSEPGLRRVLGAWWNRWKMLKLRSKLGSAVDLRDRWIQVPWFILGFMLVRMQENLGVWWAHSIYIPATGKLFEMGQCNTNRICNLARNYFHSAETLRFRGFAGTSERRFTDASEMLAWWTIVIWCYLSLVHSMYPLNPHIVHMFFLFNSIKSPLNHPPGHKGSLRGAGHWCLLPRVLRIFPRASWVPTKSPL